jgi:hypothetical protein
MTVVVFAGPTVAAPEIAARARCLHLPPARQGDVWRAVRAHAPTTIALIDGLFLQVPAVWHRELLWALSQGVAVWGAASMGALRAVELAPFGMRGVGRVFAAYRDGAWPGFPEPFEDDDEVAVVHAPAEAGSTPLSDAMVDLRATLLAAVAAEVIDQATCLDLARRMKRVHFPNRSFAMLATIAPAPLRRWLPGNCIRQKFLDAIELLDAVGGDCARAEAPAFHFERALVWERFVSQGLRQERSARLAARSARGETGGLLRPEDIESWLR